MALLHSKREIMPLNYYWYPQIFKPSFGPGTYHNLTFLRLSNYVVLTTAEKIAHFKMKENYKSNLYKLFFSSYFDAVFFQFKMVWSMYLTNPNIRKTLDFWLWSHLIWLGFSLKLFYLLTKRRKNEIFFPQNCWKLLRLSLLTYTFQFYL